MTATFILEFLPPTSPDFEATARSLVEALMIEEAALKKLDGIMYPVAPDADARRRSRQVFAAWHRWIDAAETLLRRIRLADASGGLPEYALPLDLAWGDAAGMVHITLEDVEVGREQAARGEGVPGEEVRRELQSRLRVQRAGPVEAS